MKIDRVLTSPFLMERQIENGGRKICCDQCAKDFTPIPKNEKLATDAYQFTPKELTHN